MGIFDKRKAWFGHGDYEGGALVYATTRGKARAKVARELGYPITDSELVVTRMPTADEFAELRESPTDEDLRRAGFTDESMRRCSACDLGDPTEGCNAMWKICDHCQNCSGCGCEDGCQKKTEKK